MANAARLLKTWLTLILLLIIFLFVYFLCDMQISMWAGIVQTMLPQFEGLNTWIMLIWNKLIPPIVLILLFGWAIFSSLSEEFETDFGDFE
jgi:uncharacterized BrkB/YihY/UPF0761 family membrane protein